MNTKKHWILTYDIGSTGCKTCLYELGDKLHLVDSALGEYELRTLQNGGAEQDPEGWWRAIAETTRAIMVRHSDVTIAGLSFSAQMQGLVLVDRQLKPLRPAMSYMDQRSAKQKADSVEHGIQVEGFNLIKLLESLFIHGAVSASVKDPVWKYKWVEENEPELFSQVHKWLDVKDYLIARATGVCSMTADSAYATFLTRKRANHRQWSPALLRMYGVRPEHMPAIIGSTDIAGHLTEAAAAQLSLTAGIPVFGGGGDASMISVGAGATRTGDTYVYTGTSGWVASIVDKPKVDVSRRIAAITGAQKNHYIYFAEQETAGKCLEWVRDHLALDEIDLYLTHRHVADDPKSDYESLYDFLIDTITQVPAGSEGVVFAPWLHGNRAPFEDPKSRGIFFNLSLATGKRAMIRAVVEGIFFHHRWLLDSIHRSFPIQGPVNFVGGGALSPVLAQMLADILERPVHRLADPRYAGAAGVALTVGVGLGVIDSFAAAANYLEIEDRFEPRAAHCDVYRRNYRAFRGLYPANRKGFALLNKSN
jgi:xylulokinase